MDYNPIINNPILTPHNILYAYSKSSLIRMTLSEKDPISIFFFYDVSMMFEVILSWC